MSKKITYPLVVFIAIVALIFLLPFLMGILAENKFKQVIDTISAISNAEINITNYQRHWFESDATITVSLHRHNSAVTYNQATSSEFAELQQIIATSKIDSFAVNAHILHGPIIFTKQNVKFAQAIFDSAINLTPEQNKLFNLPEPNTAIANFQTVIRLDGSSILTIDIIPFVYNETVSATTISSKDISLQMRFSTTMNKMASQFYLQNFNAKSAKTLLNIDDLKSEYLATKTISNLWVGDKNTSLAKLTINSSDMNLSLEKFNLTSSSKEAKGLVSSNTKISLDNLTLNGTKYGPNEFEWNCDKLNANILAKIKQQAKALNNQTSLFVQKGKLVNLLLALINNGAEINVTKFLIDTPNGKIDLKTHITFANQPNASFSAIMSGMNLDLELNAGQKLLTELGEVIYASVIAIQAESDKILATLKPEDLTKQADQLIANLASSGILISDSDNYKIQINYKNGNLLVNGKSPFQILPPVFNPGPVLMPQQPNNKN